jgi:tRNA dimethylallyltransferase
MPAWTADNPPDIDRRDGALVLPPLMKSTPKAIAIMGATATGKSELSIRLAEFFGGEVVSMDSRQVYRGFDIGTGKVTRHERERVQHHLIDNLGPEEVNSAGAHVLKALETQKEIFGRRLHVYFVGGTGLYFRALFEGLIGVEASLGETKERRKLLEQKTTEQLYAELQQVDPLRAGELSKNDRVRILRSLEIFQSTGITHSEHIASQRKRESWDGVKIVLTMPRLLLRSTIALRTRRMYESGWCDEVRSLLASGVPLDAPAMNGLGYNLIARAIVEGRDPEATVDDVITATQQFAKRQETFFRSVQDAVWVDVAAENVLERVKPMIQQHLEL